MKKKYIELILALGSLSLIISLILGYGAGYYSSVSSSSADYVIFSTVYFMASHMYCDKNYKCLYYNMTFPEFQNQELLKFQNQTDWTSLKATSYNSKSSIFLWIALILNLGGIYLTWTNKET